MDLSSSNHIISSESKADPQPDELAAKNASYMGVDSYEAASQGEIEVFSNYEGFELESLLTPTHNTVLHVYLATNNLKNPSGWYMFSTLLLDVSLESINRYDEFRPIFGGFAQVSRSVESFGGRLLRIENWEPKTSFIEQILNKCPSLLLQPNAKGQTPLHIAARYGHSAVVKFLINYQGIAYRGDRENQGNEFEAVREMLRKTVLESNTAFHVAVEYGHVQVVRELLRFEDPDFSYSANTNQETPLFIAARRGYRSSLDLILNKFKSLAHGGPRSRTVLHAAAMAGDAKGTELILGKNKNLTKKTDEIGQTPLYYAAHLGHYSVVKELLKWDISAAYVADKKWELTPLLMAARQGHERIVREFISCCPECCEKVDKRGWNLPHFVAFGESIHDLRYFIKDDSETAITTSTRYASLRDPRNGKDANGITPLQVLAAYQSIMINETVSNNQRTEETAKALK
ncbi:hypothetical protein PTKIN_Ptkin09bG0051800 [Pterospermum kingtungense]